MYVAYQNALYSMVDIHCDREKEHPTEIAITRLTMEHL